MITILISGIIGYIIGAGVAMYVCKPKKSFDAGFDAGWEKGKDYFGDFHRGFNAGWSSAFKKVDEALFTPINDLERSEDG